MPFGDLPFSLQDRLVSKVKSAGADVKSDFTPDEHLAFRHRVTPLEKMIRHGVYVIPTPDDQQPLAPIPKTRT